MADVMVNSPGHVGVVFAEIGTGLCETDVRRFQTSQKGPKASSDLVKTPVRPRLSIGTHGTTTKLNGGQSWDPKGAIDWERVLLGWHAT